LTTQAPPAINRRNIGDVAVTTSETKQTPTARPLDLKSGLGTLRELVAITKPRITLMVVLTAAGGMWLAPGHTSAVTVLVALGALAQVVAGANALNCWLERDTDRLMRRTAVRPLPAQRLAPTPALIFGLALGLTSVPILWLWVNPLTALLGAASLVIYVCVYTPMKQLSWFALLVGAIPGAMPPLMGWTAVTGSIDLPGLVLFGVLFIWQIPHFLAIATFRRKEYEAAGLVVLPSVHGDRAARWHSLVWTAVLLPLSLLLTPLGVAGWFYFAAALLMGGHYFWMSVRAVRSPEGDTSWSRKVFFSSLAYLPVVFAVLMADAG
jgi:protoheme IX farnesyltransferase